MLKATVDGLKNLRRPEEVARIRGLTISQVLPYKPVEDAEIADAPAPTAPVSETEVSETPAPEPEETA
jgi:hypothetical protein